MKISKASILSCILTTSFLVISANAQTGDEIETLVKDNSAKICDCFRQVDYIDSFADFDMKLVQCLYSYTNDTFLQQDGKSFEKYRNLMHEQQMQSCDAYAAKLDYVLLRPEPKLSDPIYNHQEQYQKVAKDIVGQYSMSFGSYSPEGSPTLALLDNQRYVIASFGTVLVGDWRIVKGKYLHLLSYRTEYPFYVFGRHDASLINSTKLRFQGNDFGYNTLIHYAKLGEKTPTLTPIFNADANCFSYPYETQTPNIYQFISLAYNHDYENKGAKAIDIYTFNNTQGFNNFYVLEFNRQTRREAMKAIIDDNALVFEQGRTKKRPLPEATSEDGLFFKQMSDIKLFPKTLYYNLAGRAFDSELVNQNNYTFDNDLKAYVINTKCSEDCLAAEDYDNVDIFYEYKSLEDITSQPSKFKIADESAIHMSCKE